MMSGAQAKPDQLLGQVSRDQRRIRRTAAAPTNPPDIPIPQALVHLGEGKLVQAYLPALLDRPRLAVRWQLAAGACCRCVGLALLHRVGEGSPRPGNVDASIVGVLNLDGFEPLDRFYDLPRLSAGIQAVGGAIAQCNQLCQGHGPAAFADGLCLR